MTNFQTTVNFAKGVLKLDPVTAVLFGGQQSGAITADLRSATPTYSVKAKLNNVDANELLSATTSLKQLLSGSLGGNVDLQFVAKPNEDIAKNLNGKLQVQMSQGRLAGVHILNEIASVGQFLGYSKKPGSFTDINKLAGNFNIQNGLASTNDLFVDVGGATLTGAGTMGLVDQRLNLRVTTVLRKDYSQKNPLGQIGGLLTTVLANQQGELVVPALVTGTFSQPSFAPDVEQVTNLKLQGLLPTANNPAAFTSGVQGVFGAFTGKQPEAKPAETPEGTIMDLINQFRKKKGEKKK